MRARKINEGLPKMMFDDPGNQRALRSWGEAAARKQYTFTTKEPVTLVTDDEVEAARIEFLFNKNRIQFEKSQKSL